LSSNIEKWIFIEVALEYVDEEMDTVPTGKTVSIQLLSASSAMADQKL